MLSPACRLIVVGLRQLRIDTGGIAAVIPGRADDPMRDTDTPPLALGRCAVGHGYALPQRVPLPQFAVGTGSSSLSRAWMTSQATWNGTSSVRRHCSDAPSPPEAFFQISISTPSGVS